MKKIILLAAILVLAACQQIPQNNYSTQGNAAVAEAKQSPNRSTLFGPRPSGSEQEIANQIRDALKISYFDPSSAQIQIDKYTLATATESYDVWSGKIVLCWGILIEVNAKNRYGAYTGFKHVLVYYKDGRYWLPHRYQ